MPQVVKVLVPGGKATPGPPLGPTLGPLGVNIKKVVDEINKLTKDFDGMNVPVVLNIADDRSFSVSVGTPPTSALLLRELGIEKGSKEPGKSYIGELPFEKIVKIARIKQKDMLSSTLKNSVKEVLGTCHSVGIKVDGKTPRDVQKEVMDGKYDKILVIKSP
jgi:large subunit ribosomal protein L11